MIHLDQTLNKTSVCTNKIQPDLVEASKPSYHVAITTVLGDTDCRTFSSSQYIPLDCPVLETGVEK